MWRRLSKIQKWEWFVIGFTLGELMGFFLLYLMRKWIEASV